MAKLPRLLGLRLGRQAGSLSPHPDANLLAAFAENTLLKRERAAVTAHLAGCAECREYLAVAGAVWEPELGPAEAPARRRLFKAWPWLAAAAAACVVVVVLLPRERRIESPAPPPSPVIALRTEPLQFAPAAPQTLAARRQAPKRAPQVAPQSAIAPVEMADASRALVSANKKLADAANAPEPAKDEKVDALRAPEYAKSAQGASGGVAGGVIGGVIGVASANRFAPPPGDALSQTQQQPAVVAAPAQQPSSRVMGRVTDASGAPVPFATVKAVNIATNAGVPAVTDRAGNFEVAGLAPGSYRLSAQAPGFNTAGVGPVELRAGDVSKQDLQLQVGSVSETVAVAAEAPAVKAAPAANRRLMAMRVAAPSRARWSISASGAVERSLDGGTTWEAVPLGHNVIFHTVAADGAHVWAGGTDGVLFYSSDAGLHWTETKVGAATIVSIDAQNSRLKVTNTSGAEWISEDSGLHWKPTKPR
jgi:hypothetical protein